MSIRSLINKSLIDQQVAVARQDHIPFHAAVFRQFTSYLEGYIAAWKLKM